MLLPLFAAFFLPSMLANLHTRRRYAAIADILLMSVYYTLTATVFADI
jgi:hypothetical protein